MTFYIDDIAHENMEPYNWLEILYGDPAPDSHWYWDVSPSSSKTWASYYIYNKSLTLEFWLIWG